MSEFLERLAAKCLRVDLRSLPEADKAEIRAHFDRHRGKTPPLSERGQRVLARAIANYFKRLRY